MGSVRSKTRLQKLALLLAAAVWFGCGDSKGTPAPTPTPQLTATASPTATRTPIPTATSSVLTPSPTLPAGPAGPGLLSSITDATIDSSGLIVVTFTLTDAAGVPISPIPSSPQDDQHARVRLTIAHVEDYTVTNEVGNAMNFTRYVNEINSTHPALDKNGTFQTLDPINGVYQYTFAKQLASIGPSLTYTVGMQVDRFVGADELGVNPVFDVPPVDGSAPKILESTTTQQCNACHEPLIAHGNRREVRLCMLCHTEAATDNPPSPTPPRSIDFRNMIHQLHRGKDLPLIVNGPPGSNYTIGNTVFAQKDASGVVTGVGFPRAIEGCAVCHSQGPTVQYYKERPATAACATCHDDVNPSLVDTPAGPPGTNHVASEGFGEGDCALCHVPELGNEFDISVVGAHVIPERSRQIHGLNVTLTDITNHTAGKIPTIAFKVTDNAGNPLGSSDVTSLDRLGFAMSGPTTDYTVMLTATAIGGGSSGTLSGPDASGVFLYTPIINIPANASGSWAVGAEARRVVQVTTSLGSPPRTKTVDEASPNPVLAFTIDDPTAVPRRVVVDSDHCAGCHGEFSKDFSVHGNLRNRTEYCVICHNPNQTDAARRKLDPAAVARGDQTASIDFKRMIHKLHTGDQLENKPYLIYGFGPPPLGYSITDFSDVRFPGDRRDCAKCHVNGTYLMPPFPGTALGTRLTHLDPTTGNEVEDGRLGPIRSVCTACHDAADAVAHVETMTAPDGTEACTVCHEEGRDFAVSLMHAGRR
ncbi:MAG: OmcA/MtrC family decaheme c-type cytochrome [Candidatus Binatia bacterium]